MRALQLTLMIAQGSTCLALILRGLAPRYRALLVYVSCSLARGLALAQYARSDTQYRDIWLLTSPLVTVLQVATALEAYRHSLEELPGARRLTHVAIIGISVFAACLIQIPQKTHSALGGLSLAHQAVAMVLGLAAVLMTAFLTYLRPIRRLNSVRQERILAFHLTGLALLLGLAHSGQIVWTGTANEIVSIVSNVAWTLLLTRAGETLPERPAVTPRGEGLPDLRERLFEMLRGSR